MDKVLRVLYLEDEKDFTELVSALLQKEGLKADIRVVADYESFLRELQSGTFDIILADYLLPTCTGLQALQVARKKTPATPFLLVSGTIGEQAAIESLKCGATDYVLKNTLERLVPAIRRAVVEAEEHAQLKRAETELLRREKYFRALTENSLDILSILDRDGAFRYNSPSMKTVLGYVPQEVMGQNAFAWVHPEDLTGAQMAFEKALRNPELVVSHQFRYRHQDGSWRHLEVVGRNCLEDPEIAGVVLNSRDITERKQAAEALRNSEASLAEAQRIAHLGSWELDLVDHQNIHNNTLRWSDETFRIFGLEPRQTPVSTELFFKFVHPDDRQRVAEATEQAFRNRTIYDTEHRIVLGNGQERIVRERAELALDAQGTPVQMRGAVMDITERKRLAEQLRQSQKMEAIGQLAGGVAHDFNNILTVVNGHTWLILDNKDLPKAVGDSARQISQAVERATSLTRQLLTFSRRQVMQPRRLDLNEVVSKMTMMLGRILGEDITLQLNYWPQPAWVLADASMVEQVLLNLAVNARDAMPKGGRLAIKITVARVARNGHPEARSGDFVSLEVKDSGCGIPPENLRRVFEPFFTTKEVGKGTGLGLATVYGIVQQHQGWIEVESEVGKGAAFRVFIPVNVSTENSSGQPTQERLVRGGTETILVVEDEAPVRELVCGVLRGYGYQILPAQSGVEAVELWRNVREKVDLLLTDLVMPDRINGRDLAERLRSDRPDLKVIYTSGYSADVVGKDFVLQGGLRYLQKPYDPTKLALAIRDCLDAVPA